MLCPACQAPQVIVEVEGVEVDACRRRHGLWLDAEALVALLGEQAPASGAPRVLRDFLGAFASGASNASGLGP